MIDSLAIAAPSDAPQKIAMHREVQSIGRL